MPVQSAIAWYMAYLLGMREKQKPPLLEERGEGVCKGLLLQPLRSFQSVSPLYAIGGVPSKLPKMASIMTRASIGSSETPTTRRAGTQPGKNSA